MPGRAAPPLRSALQVRVERLVRRAPLDQSQLLQVLGNGPLLQLQIPAQLQDQDQAKG